MSKKKSDGEVSASVEESNEMRKKLGIKPLAADASSTKKKGSSDNPEVAPHLISSDEPKGSDVKKRIAASRNKREHEELVSGKGLGDILSEEGSAADWIARTRSKDGSMKAVAANKDKDSKRAKKEASVPTGMKVRHDADQLQEGETIMTLADKPILNDKGELNDEEDEIANVNMMDADRTKQNDALRNQKEYDRDIDGQNILSKYDELKTGPKGFVLGGQVMGVIEETDPEKRLAILTHLSEKTSLETQPKMQADFYTTEEMEKFRKPKKKIKKRTRQADDKKDPMPVAPAGAAKAAPGRIQDAGSDEEDPELYEQLSKQRRLVRRSDAGAVRKGEAALASVSDRIQVVEKQQEEREEAKKADDDEAAGQDAERVSMTATTEFCNVVQTPLEKMDTVKHESFRGSSLYKQQATQRKGVKAGSVGYKKGAGEPITDGVVVPEENEISSETQLKENPLDLSCASGLAYLRARAQMGNDQETHKNRKSDNRPLEMSTVDGDIKLEYRDDYGRVQTPKEAFRAISWKFHGKVPGRKNMERRLLRLENEMKLKSMNPLEQLPTLRALKHVQVSEAKPYMVLSGANEK